MEKRQLDFNAPLLSARRYSSPQRFSHEEIRRAKENSFPNKKSIQSDQSDLDLSDLTKPAAVPFFWEQIPGRRKGGTDSEPQTPDEPSNTPRLPPGRALDVVRHVSGELSRDRSPFLPQSEPPKSIDTVKRDADSESCEDAYSDALDTLSPTESFSFNCSLSGLSGYEGLDSELPRTFYADPQTRDFMMSRFLPAAKAMVLDTPLHVPRKQLVEPEQPRNVKKVVSGEMRPLLKQYKADVIPQYDQYAEDVESENEDEKYDHSGNKPIKACGLLPRFCLKNSLCILNPVPLMKVRTQAPVASAGEVRRLTRTAFSGPLSRTVDKRDSDPVNKKMRDLVAVHKKMRDSGVRSHENKLTGESKRLTHSAEFKRLTYSSESKRLTYSGESKRLTYSGDMADRLSPHRRSGGISPYRNGAPRSPFHEGARFLGVPKVVENVKDSSSDACKKCRNELRGLSSNDQRYKQGQRSVIPAIEKTVYIDSVNTASISVETTKGGSTEADQSSSHNMRDLKIQTDRIEGPRIDRSFNHEARSLESLISKEENTFALNGPEKSNVGSLQSPVAPPLPKSPSESWLWRAMPSVSSKSLFVSSKFGSSFHLKKGQENSSGGTKWETIVKSSKSHYDHVRYSEELIPSVSPHSKT